MRDALSKPHRDPGGIQEMITIALPMVVSFSCDTAMTFTDRLFLAKLGSEYMSAAMAGGLTCFTLMSFFLGVIGYSTALVAQHLGAGRKKRCSIFITQAALIAVVAYPVILLCRPLVHIFFDRMGAAPAQLVLQKEYFDILIFGAIFSLWRNGLASFFSGIGRTSIVMIAAATAMVVNVGLNYLLIYGAWGFPALGIRGAAIGTIIGGMSGCAVLLAAYLRQANVREFDIRRSFCFDRAAFSKLLYYGYPAGAEFFLNLVAFTLIVFFFHAGGPEAAAASTVAFNWDMVTFVPLLGIEIGVTSLVGRYMGASRSDIAYRAVLSGLKIGFIYAAVMLALFAVYPSQLVDVFRPDVAGETFLQARPAAVAMVKMVAIYVLAEVIFIVFTGALRGAGDTFWAMSISVGLHWLLAGVVYLILAHYRYTTTAAWAAMIVIFMVFAIFPYLRFRQGRWKSLRLVEPQEQGVLAAADRFHEPSDL